MEQMATDQHDRSLNIIKTNLASWLIVQSMNNQINSLEIKEHF